MRASTTTITITIRTTITPGVYEPDYDHVVDYDDDYDHDRDCDDLGLSGQTKIQDRAIAQSSRGTSDILSDGGQTND